MHDPGFGTMFIHESSPASPLGAHEDPSKLGGSDCGDAALGDRSRRIRRDGDGFQKDLALTQRNRRTWRNCLDGGRPNCGADRPLVGHHDHAARAWVRDCSHRDGPGDDDDRHDTDERCHHPMRRSTSRRIVVPSGCSRPPGGPGDWHRGPRTITIDFSPTAVGHDEQRRDCCGPRNKLQRHHRRHRLGREPGRPDRHRTDTSLRAETRRHDRRAHRPEPLQDNLPASGRVTRSAASLVPSPHAFHRVVL